MTGESYFSGVWSASFEEHVDLAVDLSLGATVQRGAHEELNVGDGTDPGLTETVVVAVGREVVPLADDRFVLNSAAIVSVISAVHHEDVWSGAEGRRDWKEHATCGSRSDSGPTSRSTHFFTLPGKSSACQNCAQP